MLRRFPEDVRNELISADDAAKILLQLFDRPDFKLFCRGLNYQMDLVEHEILNSDKNEEIIAAVHKYRLLQSMSDDFYSVSVAPISAEKSTDNQ